MFERWRRLSDNSQWIQVSLVFQTLQQMRDKTPLSLNTPPGEVKLTPQDVKSETRRACVRYRFYANRE